MTAHPANVVLFRLSKDNPDRTTSMFDLATEIAKPLNRNPVFPAYLITRASNGLNWAREEIIREVGPIETVQGGSKYALTVTDLHGTKYRLTVEVVS